jgi:hypothetical protein
MNMSRNVFDELSDQQVPERPPEFQRQVHETLNKRLTTAHLVEFSVRLLPYAFFYFFQSLCGAVIFSFTGQYSERGDPHAK